MLGIGLGFCGGFVSVGGGLLERVLVGGDSDGGVVGEIIDVRVVDLGCCCC